jgi:hypothetical protein
VLKARDVVVAEVGASRRKGKGGGVHFTLATAKRLVVGIVRQHEHPTG